jgi:cytidylate kinase
VTDPAAGGQRTLDEADASGGPAAAGGPLIIAVDGPAGSGKSSAARGTALALGLRYLDTGAMYRALTWWLLEHGTDITDGELVARLAPQAAIEVSTDPRHQPVLVDGSDVTAEIRTRRVSNAVSAVAGVPGVRRHIVATQRAIIAGVVAAGEGIVAEGRDIGTVVAPQAAVKVFLTASEQVRAERRSAELAADPAATTEQTLADQARRDERDAPQTARAPDAVPIDTSAVPLAEVVRRITSLAAERRGGARSQDR